MNIKLTTLSTLSAFCAVALTSAAANAWMIPDQFAGPYFRNSGGNHYTCSPRGLFSCEGCHVGAEDFPPSERISLLVTAQRVNGGSLQAYDLFTDGYVPGDRYKIRVEMMGEHLGHYMDDGSYQTPQGTDYKVACAKQAGGDNYLAQLHNRNNITAEVMSEAGVYASDSGNAAGRLRPDSTNGPTAEGACLNTNRCTGNQSLPNAMEDGGPLSIMARHWVVDPTSNPPLGDWSCGVCDAITSNTHDRPTPAENGAFAPFATEFFWTAPDNVPAEEAGRIRFYIAGVDGDGYSDTLDDDVAAVRVAVCPAGSADCDPMVAQGWGLGLLAHPPGPPTSGAARSQSPRAPSGAPGWLPVALSSMFVLGSMIVIGRIRRLAMRTA
ncbi:MAG: hypothetical protein JKY37_02125 [Nannocystaceae bacterium]|nr:hypothetical protein [Nannocystaceae bacterium]